MFSKSDLESISQHGLSLEEVNKQIENFRNGFGYLPVVRAAVIEDGIMPLDNKTAEFYAANFTKSAAGKKIVKFVPASGAATRMFKDLFEFAANGSMNPYIEKLVGNIEKFAFYPTIKENTGDAMQTVKAVLAYGAELPKALILFHSYPEGPRTALEEHLVEGAMYADNNGMVYIHFTISPEHEAGFKKVLAERQKALGEKFGVRYEISFSQQESRTDTIAVTPDNQPFREEDGSLLFRPAGHGALLDNLNKIKGDIIYIKTVDNVTHDHLKGDTVLYKKAIGGILLSLQQKIFNYLEMLDRGVDDITLEHIRQFVSSELCVKLPAHFDSLNDCEKEAMLRKILDRPLRVCGMVKNEGEPGGGPFWVNNANGTVSLQIAESSQLAPDKANLLKDGTHFNPVDIVCGVTNYKGDKFDLTRYSDPSTGFISEKSKNGRALKAQELPGLWNGAMANWNTVFVEVPITTFTPVKVVNDLLRAQHQ